ncbi:MAG TPA: trypsin-like peptidase domain-containing protein [Chthoniobacterales bacterium]
MTIIRSLVLAALVTATGAVAQPLKPDVRRSVVRITTVSQEPDYRVPWNSGQVSGGIGAGFVIDESRILTNAHVVSGARFIEVEKENDPKRYPAEVVFVGRDCDLALLRISDPTFFKGTTPLAFGGIPSIQSSVDVFGYPIGGDRLSVTHGIVSRVDFVTYTYSGIDSHLAVQIDAAINPGNSGGPVLQEGKVVGIAFQGYSGDVAQNTGYMIPTPVIQRFLKDIGSGQYNGYVDLSIETFKLVNTAERRALGLPDNDVGVMVSSVSAAGASSGKLQVGDVLVAIDNHPIASDGFVQLDGERVEMAEVVERKFKGERVRLGVLRNKEPLTVELALSGNWPFLMQAQEHALNPRFVLFGGLVFQPLNRNFMEAYQVDDLRLRYFYNFFVADEIYKEHPEIIVLSNILADPVNAYLSEFRLQILEQINDRPIRRLEDVAEAFAQPADLYVIRFIGDSRPVVLERAAVEQAAERIKANYGVRLEQNLRKG